MIKRETNSCISLLLTETDTVRFSNLERGKKKVKIKEASVTIDLPIFSSRPLSRALEGTSGIAARKKERGPSAQTRRENRYYQLRASQVYGKRYAARDVQFASQNASSARYGARLRAIETIRPRFK